MLCFIKFEKYFMDGYVKLAINDLDAHMAWIFAHSEILVFATFYIKYI